MQKLKIFNHKFLSFQPKVEIFLTLCGTIHVFRSLIFCQKPDLMEIFQLDLVTENTHCAALRETLLFFVLVLFVLLVFDPAKHLSTCLTLSL